MKVLLTLFLLCTAYFSMAQDDAAEFAKKLANPVASLISLPFQNNSDFGIGSLEGTRNTLNIQPVIPVQLSDKLNLINRIVLPVIRQSNITGPGEVQSGLADAVVSAFFSPAESKITWGVGPAFLVPVGSDNFTVDQFGMGPTAVLLKQRGGLTFGGLFNQIWAFSGGENEFSQFFLQPFLVYNWPSGAGVGGNMEYTRNWTAETDVLWLNPTVSGVTSLGKQKLQLVVGPRFNLIAPDGTRANWGIRSVVIFIF